MFPLPITYSPKVGTMNNPYLDQKSLNLIVQRLSFPPMSHLLPDRKPMTIILPVDGTLFIPGGPPRDCRNLVVQILISVEVIIPRK